MIQARDFVDACLKREFSLWTGVPCSLLTPLIQYVSLGRNLDYVAATNEGEAVGIAAGAYLGGRRSVAICPNSGLGNMIDPLTSLAFPFRLPLLLIVTWRGAPGSEGEPQHELMGRITGDLLERVRVRWELFPEEPDAIDAALEEAVESMDSTGLPFAFVMREGALAEPPSAAGGNAGTPPRAEPAGSFEREPAARMTRREAIQRVRSALTGAEALVATAGRTGRELFALGHRSSQFYVAGSMGCAASIGLGIQRACDKRDVVVLDGDGAALMKLGTLATIGHCAPKRFTHVLLDNECYESTGGQATVSPGVDFAGVAAACGYRNVWWTDRPDDLADLVREARRRPGPTFIHVKVARSPDPAPGPPTLSPVQVKAQFMDWLQQG